jgi:hypothetical protein
VDPEIDCSRRLQRYRKTSKADEKLNLISEPRGASKHAVFVNEEEENISLFVTLYDASVKITNLQFFCC